jgi:hypothetical protein
MKLERKLRVKAGYIISLPFFWIFGKNEFQLNSCKLHTLQRTNELRMSSVKLQEVGKVCQSGSASYSTNDSRTLFPFSTPTNRIWNYFFEIPKFRKEKIQQKILCEEKVRQRSVLAL